MPRQRETLLDLTLEDASIAAYPDGETLIVAAHAGSTRVTMRLTRDHVWAVAGGEIDKLCTALTAAETLITRLALLERVVEAARPLVALGGSRPESYTTAFGEVRLPFYLRASEVAALHDALAAAEREQATARQRAEAAERELARARVQIAEWEATRRCSG